MKKILMLTMCLALIPMLFAGKATFEPETSTATEQLQRDQSQPVTDMAPIKARPFTPARGETLYYGDGTFDGSLGITGAGTVPGPDETFGFATYFVLSDFGITDPRKVGTILLQYGVVNGTDYRLYVWDDAGTVPNSHGTHLYVDMAVPLPAPDVWQEIDLSALDIVLPDSFWIGICYNYMSAGTPSDWYLSYNSAIADPHTFGNLGGTAADWTWLGNFGYGFAFGVRVVVEETGGPATFWDFEDGWQGWTHTNGEVFPAAWGVQPSGIHTPCPNPGDSSMWIDSDASGGGYSDSALSPLLIPNPTMDWLKYGYYNYGGGSGYENELRVGIKHFTGGVWNVVELAYYPAGVTSGPAWDSVDVSAYAASDSVQVYFYHDDLGTWGYYSAFDNVGIYAAAEHDVGCVAVTSPTGLLTPGDYDVIGQIHNFGVSAETFDVTADVYDITGGGTTQIFTNTVTFTDFAAGYDSTHNFGLVTFGDGVYYTEIYTLLAGDEDPANDTSSAYATTETVIGTINYELDATTPTGDVRLLGVEFDGTYFYLTGARDYDSCFVYVLDTLGTVIWAMYQPDYCHGTWGWRDIAWDGTYAGPDRIDTLYASVGYDVDKFGIDLSTGTLTNYGSFTGPITPNRALAYDGDDDWFFTASFSSDCYKFDKTNPNIQQVTNPGYAMYGAAYDTYSGWIWWHSQDGPYTWRLQIEQMFPQSMEFTGQNFNYIPTGDSGVAGGLCFYESFRGNQQTLFAMVQGTPVDLIVGILLRETGIEERPETKTRVSFGFAPMTNPTKSSAISYITTTQGKVSLKVYDGTGRLVETLVNSVQPVGVNTVNWDTRNIANGVYFIRLEAENQHATHKLILIK